MYLSNNNKSMRHNRLTPARAATALAQAARRATAALAIILLTAMTAWAQDAITGLTYNSTGGYYEISDAQDLVVLANYVNATENISIGKTFKQTQDIDMSRISNFTPIGSLSGYYSFQGTYDGDGHTISGLTVSKVSGDIGLFGTVRGATVRNVILLSPNVKATTTNEIYNVKLGALIGKCSSGSSNLVENCHVVNPTVSSSATGSNYVGAIIGYIWDTNTTATNCYYYDGNATAACGFIENGATVTNVCAAHLVTPADGVIIQTAMAADLGFSCDADNNGTAENYWRTGAPLTLSHADREGYTFGGYTVNGTAIDGNTFTMPDENVTIAATFTPDPAQFSVNDAGTEYTIHTAGGWNVFCDLLESGESFSGKTVRLGDDIGTAENPVIRRAGSTGHEFAGTFDGGGYTLTVSITGTVQGTAPFCEIKGATIRNLVVTGSVAGMRHSAGLVGFARGDDASVENTIENCLVATDVSITGDNAGYLGGIVGHGLKCKLTIRGCAFTGSLTSEANYTGGLQGWSDGNTLILENDIFAASSVNAANVGFHPIAIHVNNASTTATVSNVYYTVEPTCTTSTRIAAAGKQAHTVTAGDNVTIDAIALTGTTTQYTVSGITAYSGGGLQLGETLYYGTDDQLSLTLSNTAAPLGYQYAYTAYTASAGTLSGTTLTMPDADVTISVNNAGALRSDGLQHEVSYMTADGTTQTEQAIALDGHEAVDEDGDVRLAAGTYYVGTDIAYANRIRPAGDITLILADGKTMTLNGNKQGIFNDSRNLTIYGQSLDDDAGTLRYNSSSNGIHVYNYEQHSGNVRITTTGLGVSGIVASDVTLRGGTLTVSADGDIVRAIKGYTLSILGGHLTATATGDGATGIYASADDGTAITLGWTRPADRITASSISTGGGTVAVADGQALTDGSGNIYTGTLTASELSGFAAETTLQPALQLADKADNATQIATLNGIETAAILSGRTLYKDGSWNTLCLPFDISTASGTLSGDNVQAMTLNTTTSNLTDGTLTLNFTAATTIPAGTPFIIKWDESGTDIENPVFYGVTIDANKHDATVTDVLTFTGTYAPVTIDDGGDNTKLYLGSANTLYYPTKAMTIGCHRAYFQLADGITAGEPTSSSNAQQIHAFNLNFGDDEATGIVSAEANSSLLHSSLSEWYTLDGRKLDGQPTAKGLYIHGGKKVVVK